MIKQYQKLFDMENVSLKFTDGAMVAVAKEALKRENRAHAACALSLRTPCSMLCMTFLPIQLL